MSLLLPLDRPLGPTPGTGAPCRVPARTVRVGALPRPRVRPLAEVLATLPRTPPPPAPPEAVVEPGDDVLADAARPAALALCGLIAEILDGRRASTHLRALCDDDLYRTVAAGLAPRRRSAARGRVHTVRVCAVGPAAVEVAGVVHRDGRARGIAARLERDGTDGRGWRLRALAVP